MHLMMWSEPDSWQLQLRSQALGYLISYFGLILDDNTIKVAVDLHLGMLVTEMCFKTRHAVQGLLVTQCTYNCNYSVT